MLIFLLLLLKKLIMYRSKYKIEKNELRENRRKFMEYIMDRFEKIRGKCWPDFEIKFWDAVVITASDENQKLAIEGTIKKKIKFKEIPQGLPYLVFADPPGPKTGNGGATLNALEELVKIFKNEFWQWRILLIHSGGYSQRLPLASILGKLFIPLPKTGWQMLELKLAMYLPFLSNMAPGILVTCSDDIETFSIWDLDDNNHQLDNTAWSFDKEGFTVLGHCSTLEIGEQHGVYVLPELDLSDPRITCISTYCLEVLQKPSRQLMHQKNAVNKDYGVCSDSIFFMSTKVLKILLNLYLKHKPILTEVDCYRDFLQALGQRSTPNYINSLSEPASIQLELYKQLHDMDINVVLLTNSNFHHIGTEDEYITNLSEKDGDMFTELSFRPVTHSSLDFEIHSPNVTIMRSVIKSAFTHCGTNIVIDNCRIDVPISIGDNSILSHCHIADCVNIPNNVSVHTSPIDGNYVTFVFSINDDLKKWVRKGEEDHLKFCGHNLNLIINRLGISGDICEGDYVSLWKVRIFPVASSRSKSLQLALALLESLENDSLINPIQCNTFVSMEDTIKKKNIEDITKFEDDLLLECK